VEGTAEDTFDGSWEGNREVEELLEGPGPTGGREMQQGVAGPGLQNGCRLADSGRG